MQNKSVAISKQTLIWVLVAVLGVAGVITLFFAFRGSSAPEDDVNVIYTNAALTVEAQQLTLLASQPTATVTPFVTLTPFVTNTAFASATLPTLSSFATNTLAATGGCDNSVYISDVTIHSLRTQMGVMMQDSFIFSGTIMDNIRYGNDEATDEDVIRAAQTVCAHEFIMTLEDGYHTEVNERGSRLSAGQRQLISFARAVLADPKILIPDEATSAIDT